MTLAYFLFNWHEECAKSLILFPLWYFVRSITHLRIRPFSGALGMSRPSTFRNVTRSILIAGFAEGLDSEIDFAS